MIEIKPLPKRDLSRLAEIDRSEHITIAYRYTDERHRALESWRVDWQVPDWPLEGEPDFSVSGMLRQWAPILERDGVLLAALDGETLAGIAMLRYHLADSTGQLALLFVSRPYRREGVASKLLLEVECLARQAGLQGLYVSATPSQSAVGFYRACGFDLADPVNPALFELEPEDIHLFKRL
jgi:GNAT superfamily N-acetyltransferase